LQQTYRDRGVQALVVDVMETPEVAKGWAERWKFSFPVLHDPDGTATSPWAPPDAVPDLPRDQVPIASNLIIDPEGKIRFYSLLDSANFDAKLIALQARLDELLAQDGQ
jgi:peroxiredoxin